MEAFNFAVANEDHNIYIFDMRKMDKALNILKDHVVSVNFSEIDSLFCIVLGAIAPAVL